MAIALEQLEGVQRLSVKLFVEGSPQLGDDLLPVFHRWVRDRVIPGQLLIDVADYRHVHHGPGLMVVAHEAHYAMDEGDGRLGLRYDQKRGLEGTVPERMMAVWEKAWYAARLLEQDPTLGGRLKFRRDEYEIRVQDALRAPDHAAAVAALRQIVE